METILQTVLDVPGVGAALVLDGGGRLLGHRGRAVYDQALCVQLAAGLTKALDAVHLQQEDWESLSARYADGKLLVRNLGSIGGVEHALAVVADATLNPSFATVAIRVASNKLKKALSGGGMSSLTSSVGAHVAAPGQGSAARAMGSSPGLASSGLSWSQTSSVGLSRVPVADPASSAFLTRAAKELARHVGPIAKVYVEEGVRRVCPDAPFSLETAPRLVLDLAGQIEDGADRKQFQKALERA
jgi:hypothetical protein